MSQYTTGEVAKLCGVSVRTVQYYDSRKLLTPTALSEGGRRLYSQEDVERLKVICFLRETGFSIKSIGDLLTQQDPGDVIDILLDQQEQALTQELDTLRGRLENLRAIRRGLRGVSPIRLESIGDVAKIMKNKRELFRLRLLITCVGLGMDAVEVATAIYWWRTGRWQPFALGMVLVLAVGTWVTWFYFSHVAYICPHCHATFRPRLAEALFARHTPRTRRLTCPHCGKKGDCVEVWNGETVGDER